jgi:hypothetical protein
MGFSFSQSLLDLAPHSRCRAAFLFKKAQAVPQPDDFPLFAGVHTLWEHKGNDMASR